VENIKGTAWWHILYVDILCTGFRYTQTPDGIVWLGYKQTDGSYEATVYMRPPDCNAG